MPRRTSLDPTTWKKLNNNCNIPSLLEYCIDSLVLQLRNNKEYIITMIEKISFKKRQYFLNQLIERKKLTRESLNLFSFSLDYPSCVSIDLSNSPVTDYGLYIISGITCLRKLQLHNCRNITNKGLSYIKYLSNLEQLNISKCKQITDEGLPALSYLYELVKLEINDINGGIGRGLCAALGRLKKLEYLSIDRCRFISSFLPCLQSLSNLKTLSFKDTKTIQDDSIVNLTNFPSLTELDLSGTMISTRGLNIIQSLFMGRDDINKVTVYSPALVHIDSQHQIPTNIKPDKYFKKLKSLTETKKLEKYISGLTTMNSSSNILISSLKRLNIKENENHSFKESSPIVQQRLREEQPLLSKSKLQSLEHGFNSQNHKILENLKLLNNEDSDIISETESDSSDFEILLSSDDEIEEEEHDITKSLFNFNDVDDLLDVEIQIGAIPQTENLIIEYPILDNDLEEQKEEKNKQITKRKRGRPRSKSIPDKENISNTNKSKLKQKTQSKSKSKTSPKTTKLNTKNTKNNIVASKKTTKPRRVSLCREFAQISLGSDFTSNRRRTRSKSLKK